MKPEDFAGIQAGDWILINGRAATEYQGIAPSGTLYGVGFSSEIDLIISISVLTGPLSPWSSPWVPDWADWCIQDTRNGTISFYDGIEYKGQTLHSSLIVTKRPAWRGKNE